MVRIDQAQLRPVAGDSDAAQAVKVVARAHQTLIWERIRTFQRLRNILREYLPAALNAYADLSLTSADALELLIKAPTPAAAAKLTRAQITAILARHRRHNRTAKAATIQTALREEQLGLPEQVTAAYAATAQAHARLIIALNEQIAAMEEQVKTHFLAHPDAEIYLSMPGIAEITGRPGACRVRRRPHPLHLRESPQELRRHQPHHPGLRQERPARLARRPPLLRKQRVREARAVSKPVPATTKRPPGHTMPTPLPLDLQRHGVSEQGDPPPHRGRRDFRRPRGRDPPRTLRQTRSIVPFAIPSAMGLSQAFP